MGTGTYANVIVLDLIGQSPNRAKGERIPERETHIAEILRQMILTTTSKGAVTRHVARQTKELDSGSLWFAFWQTRGCYTVCDWYGFMTHLVHPKTVEPLSI